MELRNLYKEDTQKKINKKERNNKLYNQVKQNIKNRKKAESKRIKSEPIRTIQKNINNGISSYTQTLKNIGLSTNQ